MKFTCDMYGLIRNKKEIKCNNIIKHYKND